MRARPIAVAPERVGHSVWWDRHIKGGSEFSKEIEQALSDADAVVVLWSERSVASLPARSWMSAKRAGLLDYWRQSGKWPDFCFDDDQPYDCKSEAAELAA